jgi:uncharacterized Zn finger protein (UPF0148 family)
MTIKRLAPKNCPNCGAEKTLYIADDQKLTCQLCGHKFENITQYAPKRPERPKKRFTVTYSKMYKGDLGVWASSAYDSGLAYVQQDKLEEAIKAFQRALEDEPEFVDAHLWLGRLFDDPDKKRHHFGEVIAQMTNNLEVIRELMVLKGELTREEADRSLNSDEPNVQVVGAPVEAKIDVVACEVCGSKMHLRHDGVLECMSCGNIRAPHVQNQGYGMKMLSAELLKRRGQAIQWQVGERLLRCGSCGAETILKPTTLSTNCPFCNSRQVVETDALKSFTQPNGIVPFKISEEQARKAVDKALDSIIERLAGWFINNKVADIRVSSVYVPFWLYDVTMNVNRTITDNDTSHYRYNRDLSQMHRTETLTDAVFDLPISGVKSPDSSVLDRLEKYDLSDIMEYHTDLLASHTAELYSIDFEKASLFAMQSASKIMRQVHGQSADQNVNITVSSMVQMMQFRLVLLPMYVFTLTERDGDVRVAVVHGQRGQVVLGRAVKMR